MKIIELRTLCEEAGEYVLLHLPPPNSQGYTRRLCDSCGPRGKVLSGTSERGQLVRFRTDAVLRYLDRESRKD